jgi:hypothetical protein
MEKILDKGDESKVVERTGLPGYLDDMWSDIWDLMAMEVNELRSVMSPE